MATKKSINHIAAVAFSIFLLASSGAQAGSLLGPNGDRAIERASVLDQATTWILDAWTGLTSVFAFSLTTPESGTQSCTTTGGCGGEGDAGPGIDPEG